MSALDTGWETTRECELGVADAATVNDDYDLDGDATGPLVLMIGGESGICVAVEGTREQLIRFADRVTRLVNKIPEKFREDQAPCIDLNG
ncbi:hypothetical protein K1T35_47505 (plasmid) [Pseudonocardia sp. DSM 110487]|uniref:hypothetical protein n=1 Tax=Pseudonocardia sp. DSM 110487 TaxID=2865833 RepID=UPI001C6A1B12|nr:hypothetical protein [Pseudonocardia sp. DSM 110487]QYN40997.1 hypothetical protein K1T35_47505 [Pseudonocardia sp. DSM 110487]